MKKITTLALFLMSVASVFAQDYSVMITTNKTPSTFFPNHAARHAPGGADTLTSHYATNAPSDGTTYGMKDGQWAEVTSGGSVSNYAFSAAMTTNQSFALGVWKVINYNTVAHNNGGAYDGTNTYTVPVNGTYLFGGVFGASSPYGITGLYTNGQLYRYGAGDASRYSSTHHSVLYLSAGAQVQMYFRSAGAGTQTPLFEQNAAVHTGLTNHWFGYRIGD